MKEISFNFEPGFSGHDSMREKAERLFREDISHSGKYPVKESASAKDREHRRPYKKGGHVNHEESHKKTSHKAPRGKMHHLDNVAKRARLHHEQEKELSDVKKLIRKESKIPTLNKGGRCHKNYGGPMEATQEAMKKGGRVKKAFGGMMPAGATNMPARPMAGMRRIAAAVSNAPRMAQAAAPAEAQMKKGGRVKKSFGGMMKAANAMGANNMAQAPAQMKKGGKCDEEKRRNHLAIGGSGKIRHGEMTKAGKPINKRGRALGR